MSHNATLVVVLQVHGTRERRLQLQWQQLPIPLSPQKVGGVCIFHYELLSFP